MRSSELSIRTQVLFILEYPDLSANLGDTELPQRLCFLHVLLLGGSGAEAEELYVQELWSGVAIKWSGRSTRATERACESVLIAFTLSFTLQFSFKPILFPLVPTPAI